MNDPVAPLDREIERTAEWGFDYLELTLEPPAARVDTLDAEQVRQALESAGLGVVGHTAYYLPVADPFPRLRAAALAQLSDDIAFLAAVGVDKVTVHPSKGIAYGHDPASRLAAQREVFAALCELGAGLGVTVMCENLTDIVGDPDLLAEHLFDRLPALALNLDVAHAGLGVADNRTPRFLARLGDRLRHLHLSDNNGLTDLHLPLGAGRLPLCEMVGAIRRHGYDDTVTLEVFSRESHYLRYSAQLVRQWWSES